MSSYKRVAQATIDRCDVLVWMPEDGEVAKTTEGDFGAAHDPPRLLRRRPPGLLPDVRQAAAAGGVMAREPKYVEEMRKRAAAMSNRELLDAAIQARGYVDFGAGSGDIRASREDDVLFVELERRLGKWLEA